MQIRALLISTVIVSALGGVVYAQQPSEQPAAQQPRETHPQTKDSQSDGTKPENMGSTGWTGGTGGSHIGTSNSLTDDGAATNGTAGTTGSGANAGTNDPTPNSEAAKDQPLMATGVDLKGEPTRFPANKTPQ